MNRDTNGKYGDQNFAGIQAHIAKGNLKSAERMAKQCLKQNAADIYARYLLGVVHFELGNYENALSEFQQVHARSKDIPEIKTNIGVTLAALGRHEEAIQMLQAVLKKNPGDVEARDNLIQALLENGEREVALKSAEARIKRDPEDPEGYFLRGQVYLQSNHFDRARDDFQHAIEMNEADPRFHYNYGFASYLAGEKPDAQKAFQKFYATGKKGAAYYVFENSAKLFQQACLTSSRSARLREGKGLGTIVGVSPPMQDIFEMIERVAPLDITVLIRGETGTGKELVAREIYKNSTRGGKPFEVVNCAAQQENLVESDLFGHEKGAYTGATKMRRGKFELADGGTIFLDEIGDMTLASQVKLLRVLQEKQFERLGGEKTFSVDVRILAATNRPLEDMVKEGTFREDLYYRLNVFEITAPPLRERLEDLTLLVDYFMSQNQAKKDIHHIDPLALEYLMAYDWPGNVRELQNTIDRASVMARGDTITEEDLPGDFLPEERPRVTSRPSGLPEDPEEEKARILKTLEDLRWNRRAVATVLGISPRHLYRRMDALGIQEKVKK